MKAIFELAAPAARLVRAESAGEALCDCARPSEDREERDSDERDERHGCRVPASATLRALASPPRSAPRRGPRAPRASTGSLGRGGRGGAVTVTAASLTRCASITSTMLNVKVNEADPTDLYEQVAAEIRRAIADGEAKPGERLPPAKDLAAILDVNTNTVLRCAAPAPRRGTARVPARPRHLGRRNTRTRRRRPASERARRLRPPPGLPPRRASRDHRRRRLTKPPATVRSSPRPP